MTSGPNEANGGDEANDGEHEARREETHNVNSHTAHRKHTGKHEFGKRNWPTETSQAINRTGK